MEAVSAAAALRNFANTPANRAAIRCGMNVFTFVTKSGSNMSHLLPV